MIKIFMTVRNRLAITKKAIEALERNSAIPHNLYIYDNCTNYRIREHFEFAYNLYKHKIVSKYVFNTDGSTFNAFSKAVACNEFGYDHQQDPKWKSYEFITILDNDIIVLPGWDQLVKNAWQDIHKYGLDSQIKIVGQLPGGIKCSNKSDKKFGGCEAKIGKLGGSGFWNISTNFFRDVGYLDLNRLVGYDKRHDSEYWNLLERVNKGKPYIIGLNSKLCIHCGKIAGSVCNQLSRNRGQKDKINKIKFEEAEDKIEKMSFDEFMKVIKGDKNLMNNW